MELGPCSNQSRKLGDEMQPTVIMDQRVTVHKHCSCLRPCSAHCCIPINSQYLLPCNYTYPNNLYNSLEVIQYYNKSIMKDTNLLFIYRFPIGRHYITAFACSTENSAVRQISFKKVVPYPERLPRLEKKQSRAVMRVG